MAGGSWREGPAGEGRRRLQEVRAAAQREAAEGPAEGCHGFPDKAASATPVVRVPSLRSGRRHHYPLEPASEPSQTPPTSRLLEPSTPDRPATRRDLLCIEGRCREACRELWSLRTTSKMAGSVLGESLEVSQVALRPLE